MVHAIMSLGPNGELGNGTKLCYRSLFDLRFFRFLTIGKPVIMGWNTFVSLNQAPLPDRLNIVLKKNKELELVQHRFTKKENCWILEMGEVLVLSGRSIIHLLEYELRQHQELSYSLDFWVIGGAKTYELFDNVIEEYLITHMQGEHDGADIFYQPPCLKEDSYWKKTAFPMSFLDQDKIVPVKSITKYYR